MTGHLKTIYDICEGLSLAYLVLGAFTICALCLFVLNYFFLASDKIYILLRWARFLLECAYIYIALNFVFGLRGLISLCLLSLFIAIWAELSYVWLKAIAYSKRGILPFSNMLECASAWRQGKKYYKLREKIEQSGFVKLKSFKATDRVSLANLFYSSEDKIALLVLFRLHKSRLRTIYFLLSKKEDGSFLVYTNDFSEDILFLKGKYSMHYRQLSTFSSLLKKQRRAMKYSLDTFVDFKDDSENLPHLLYGDNLSSAITANIYSKIHQEGELLTAEGKFQYCKKLIIKNYFRI